MGKNYLLFRSHTNGYALDLEFLQRIVAADSVELQQGLEAASAKTVPVLLLPQQRLAAAPILLVLHYAGSSYWLPVDFVEGVVAAAEVSCFALPEFFPKAADFWQGVLQWHQQGHLFWQLNLAAFIRRCQPVAGGSFDAD